MVIWNRYIRLLLALLLCHGLDIRGLADVPAEANNLIKNHLAHVGNLLDDLEAKIKRSWAGRLVRCVVPDREVGVFQRLFNGDTRGRVECKHAVEEIKGVRVSVGEEFLEGDLVHVWQVSDIVLGARGANAAEGFFIGGSEVVENLVQLVNIITALEEWATTKQFSEDAANRPDVDYTH